MKHESSLPVTDLRTSSCLEDLAPARSPEVREARREVSARRVATALAFSSIFGGAGTAMPTTFALAQDGRTTTAIVEGARSDQVITQDTSAVVASPVLSRALPLPTSPAQVFCIDPITGRELRIINIYRESPSFSALQDKAAKRHHVYYHAPFGGFVENDHPLTEVPGMGKIDFAIPNIVHAISAPDENGTRIVLMKFSVTSPELREVCRNAVLKMDKTYALQSGAAEADVIVNYYPVTQAMVRVYHPLTNRKISEYRTDCLKSAAEIEVYLPVQREDFKLFMESINNDQARFEFSTQGSADEVAAANIEISCSKEVQLAVRADLNSEQVDGKSPIFQEQAIKATQSAKEVISRTIRETRPGLAMQIDSGALMAKIFDATADYPCDKLLDEYDAAAERFNEFIRPHLETWQKEMAQQGVEISLELHEVANHKGGGRGGSFLGFGAKKKWDKMEHDINRLERISGTSFRDASGGTRFAPHSIKIKKLKEGWTNVVLTSQDTIFSNNGPEYRFISDTAFRPSWTVTFGRSSLGLARTHFNGVQQVVDENNRQKVELDKGKADLLAEQKGRAEDKVKAQGELKIISDALEAEKKRSGEFENKLTDAEKGMKQLVDTLSGKGTVFPTEEARYQNLLNVKKYLESLGIDSARADRYAHAVDQVNAVATPSPTANANAK